MSKFNTVEEVQAAYKYPSVDFQINGRYWSMFDQYPKGTVVTPEIEAECLAIMQEDPVAWAGTSENNVTPVTHEAAKIIFAQLQAQKQLDEIVAEFNERLSAAEALADKHNLTFNIYPAYGMGGSYDGEEGEWSPSSQSC